MLLLLRSKLAKPSVGLPVRQDQGATSPFNVNIAWLGKLLVATGQATAAESGVRAHAIYAAVVGAQLVARSRADIALHDTLIDNYRAAGLLPR